MTDWEELRVRVHTAKAKAGQFFAQVDRMYDEGLVPAFLPSGANNTVTAGASCPGWGALVFLNKRDYDDIMRWSIQSSHVESDEFYSKGLVPSYLPPSITDVYGFRLGPVEDRLFFVESLSGVEQAAWLCHLAPYVFVGEEYANLYTRAEQFVLRRVRPVPVTNYMLKEEQVLEPVIETEVKSSMFWCEPWVQIRAWEIVKNAMTDFVAGADPPFEAVKVAWPFNISEDEKELMVAEAILISPSSLAARGMRTWISQRRR